MSGATVTPTGVRDGDPAALAGLCAVRGPSVVAYCRHVAGEADAGAAAADAFARFRVAVVAAGDTASLNPEALLVSATRTSAAARAQANAQGDCAEVPVLLAERAEKTIAPGDLERLESHLEECWACRAPVARFKAAERAYRDPPEKTVDVLLTAQIVGALIAAVPSAPPPKPAPESPNGSVEQAAAAEAPAAPPEQPTEHFTAPDMDEPPSAAVDAEPGADADADGEAAIAAARRRRRERKMKASGAGAVLGRLGLPTKERGPRERPRRQPRPPRQPPMLGAPLERSARSRRPALRLSRVLPIVLILLALLAALYVSGVFGGDDPASTPAVSAPTAAPAEVELDAVPGARNATADDVESAKARARGEDVPAAKKKEAAQADSAPAAASPPPASAGPPPAAPAVSPNIPVNPPPPAERDAEPSDDKQIDAGSGATGAEQVPPAGDATDVPDLAPPTDPATTP